MANLLDYFSGRASQEDNAGLLGFATQILNASSGRQPVNFGQALAAGAQGMQQGRRGYVDLEREKQAQELQAKVLGLKIQDAESDLQNQAALRTRAESLRKFYMNDAQGGAASGQPSAGVLPSGASVLGLPQMGAAAPQAAPTGGGNTGIYQQRLAQAERLRAQGFAPEADAAEAAALKFQPKVKGWEKVQQEGKVLFAPFYEDGTSGPPVPLEVAEKLEKVDRGGMTDLVNSYTGNTVRQLSNSQSPDSAASVAATLRGQDISAATAMRGQNMVDSRARETLQQGKVPPGYRYNADGSLSVIPGGPADPKAGKEGAQRVQDARDVLTILDEAEPLLSKATSSYAGAGLDALGRGLGISSDSGEAAAQLKVLQGALVSKMPKMSGPQSDKDVQLYREMAGQIGDPTLPEKTRRAAAQTVRRLNEKYLSGTAAAPATSAPRTPMKGQVVDGYKFKGGDPSDPSNWERK